MRTRRVAVLLLASTPVGCLQNASPVDAGAAATPGWVVSRPFPDVASLQDVVMLGEGRAVAVGTAGTILQQRAGRWTKDDAPTTEDLESVSAYVDAEQGVEVLCAAGAAGTILQRVDEAPWTVVPVSTTAHLFGAWVADPSTCYAVGEAGTIVRVEDGAARVMVEESLQLRVNPDGTEERYPIPETLKAVGGGWRDDVVAVGARGAAYHFDGTSWTREDADTSRPLTDLFSGAGIWSTTTDGVVLYRNGFSDWDADSFRAPAPVFLQGVWTDWSLLVAVGFAGALFVREDGDWKSIPLDEELVLRAVSGVVVREASGESPAVYDVVAVGGGGRIVRGPTALPDPDAGVAP